VNRKIKEIKLGICIWDEVVNHLDNNIPEIQNLTELEQEKIYGDAVRGVAEILVDDIKERCDEMVDEIQQENLWGVYYPDEDERKFSYEEASRGY
jgi:hypothetical protein